MSDRAARPVAETASIAVAALSGWAASANRAPSAKGGHHDHVMGEDVVHLAGDTGPLGRGGDRRLLVAVPFEAFGAVAQQVEVARRVRTFRPSTRTPDMET
jgi:hypothetical protein